MAFNLSKQSYLPTMPDAGITPLDGITSNINVMKAFNGLGRSMGYSTPYEMVGSLGLNDVEAMGMSMTLDNLNDATDTTIQIEQAEDTMEQALPQYTASVSSKPFNLKKEAQFPIPQQENVKDLYFQDHQQLKEYLDSMRHDLKGLMNDLANNKISDAKEAIEIYYGKVKDFNMGIGSKEGLLDYVNSDIYQILPPNLKDEGGSVRNTAANTKVQEAIKKIAEKNTIKKDVKSFNLNKIAQHKTQENVIMYGPEQTRKVDPFSRQPISDWHIVERNKGFGLVVDDVWNIDYETIWRENIMDKYSRPYKNKEGEWVGGYLNKRFETDKNIPASSNIQLKPGQKRRPIVPEYGNTESRLQAARAAGDITGANDTSAPFNWKEASSKKKSLVK